MRPFKMLALVAAISAAVVATPAAATAATVRAEWPAFHLEAASGEVNALTIDYRIERVVSSELDQPAPEYVVTVTDEGGSLLIAGPDCTALGVSAVCRIRTAYLRSFIDLGDRDDRLDTTLAWGRVDAGPGHDAVRALNNSVLGIDGGMGGDTITGGIPTFAARTEAVSVTLDDGAPDGAAREGDDIRAAHALIGGSGDDMLTASPLRETIVHGGAGADALRGTAASDLLIGNSGDDDIQGFGGDDELHGDHHDLYVIHPDAPYFRSHPTSGGGNDVLVGGPGSDQLVANEGDDVFQMRDDERDQEPYCGIGADIVYIDGVDEAVTDPDCER